MNVIFGTGPLGQAVAAALTARGAFGEVTPLDAGIAETAAAFQASRQTAA